MNKSQRKGQKMLGLQIINGVRRDGDGFDGGKILDPENGKEYRCKMTVIDGGKKLEVRGYIGVSYYTHLKPPTNRLVGDVCGGSFA